MIIAIANTLDLPERMMARVGSRVGMTRVDFKPYAFQQIEAIIRYCHRHITTTATVTVTIAIAITITILTNLIYHPILAIPNFP